MTYLNTLTSQYPLTERDIREANPNVSFPEVFSPTEDYEWVFPTPQPTYDKLSQIVVLGTPALTHLGSYEETWEIKPRFYDYTDSENVLHTAQEQLDAEIARNTTENNLRLRTLAKANRQTQVDAIEVTTSTGKTFDGDEMSQTRMARAIVAMQATNTPTVTWVLADNTATQATIQELTEALALAGAAQAAIWVLP